MRIVTWLFTNAVALAAAAWLIDGIRFTPQSAPTSEKVVPLILVALILGAVTAFVKPVLKLLSFPLILLTLGLFLLVINAGMLLLTDAIADALDIGFRVTGFWPAVGGAIVITVVTWLVDGVIGRDD
ncbi:phage holin family protein [Nocardioides marinus]|uniref:Putative membrane protein n=1 Tax=Nocardioides marinus TaxID=374514 RepID=A0A7Y9YGL5_9ACTN|nr:phage holin family protein [Actinomycetota bacterium]NYI11866.1 putative membrane protein [Nocardioides marinus]